MELVLTNKYITPRLCQFNITAQKSCPLHDIVKRIHFRSPTALFKGSAIFVQSIISNMRVIVAFLINWMKEKQPITLFIESFEKLSSYHNSEPIELIPDIIWLLKAISNWIINQEDSPYVVSQIKESQKSIIDQFEGDPCKILPHMVKLLSKEVNSFTRKCYPCQCQYKIQIRKEHFDTFGIGNRIDLVQKFLSEDGFVVYSNFRMRLNIVVAQIKSNLRKIEYVVGTKLLKDIPKIMWTDIYVRYFKNTCKLVYVDSDHNIVDVYDNSYRNDACSSEETEGGETEGGETKGGETKGGETKGGETKGGETKGEKSDNKKYAYIYQGENDPNPIYEVSFSNQTFCIFCDTYKKTKSSPKIFVNPYGHQFTEQKPIPNGLYVCRRLCNTLAFHCQKKISYFKNIYENHCSYNIRNLRYAKNRMLGFYTGCVDSGSSLVTLENVDVRRYIIWILLDLLGIGPEEESIESAEKSDSD
jgi:hypothetical protein